MLLDTAPMGLNIVLIEPEIPQNTGNIARTCAAIGASLHLVEPLGFSIDDRHLRRAGLDYWSLLDVHRYRSQREFFDRVSERLCIFASTKGHVSHAEMRYADRAYIVFGNETTGLADSLLRRHGERTVRIPMRNGARSLNLSNAVAIVAFEALRQLAYPGLVVRPNTMP